MLLLKISQKSPEFLGLRNNGAGLMKFRDGWLATFSDVLDQLFDVDQADHVVDRLTVDRNPALVGFGEETHQIVPGRAFGNRDHFRSRRHDLADRRVEKFDETLHDLALFTFDDPCGLPHVEKGPNLTIRGLFLVVFRVFSEFRTSETADGNQGSDEEAKGIEDAGDAVLAEEAQGELSSEDNQEGRRGDDSEALKRSDPESGLQNKPDQAEEYPLEPAQRGQSV